MVPKACRDLWRSRKIAQDLIKARKDKVSHETNLANFEVIGSNSLGSYPSLLVNSEGLAYLFNCSEGTQRLCYSNKARISNICGVFLTTHSWDRVSGTHGLALCAQEAGNPSLTVYSNDRIENFFTSTYSFIKYVEPECLKAKGYSELNEYKDRGLCIEAVPIESASTNTDDAKAKKRPKTQATIIAYACTLPDLSGSLDANKCRELKVPIGSMLAKLKAGNDVTLPDGRLIKSADVCGPRNLGMKFIVIECPTEKDIDAVLRNPKLDELRKSRKSANQRQIEAVIHFSPTSVTDDPKYRGWMNGFDQTCQHIFLCHNDARVLNLPGSYRMQYLMNRLDKEIFPINKLPELMTKQIESELSSQIEDLTQPEFISKEYPNKEDNIIKFSSNDRLIIRPRAYYELANIPIDAEHYVKEAKEVLDLDQRLAELRKLQDKLPKPKEYEPELVFLGTVSATPSKYRNSSGILLNFSLPFEASVLLDCGEDTYGQMYRQYGSEKLKQVLRRLKLIYISHHHADHHIGLIKLLKHRKQCSDEPVAVVLAPNLNAFLDFHNDNFEDLRGSYEIFSTVGLKTFPNVGVFNTESEKLIKSTLIERTQNLLDDIKVVGVEHCVNACATVIRFKIGHPDLDTYTVAYSGDARPCQEFILAGKGCDLLIHEATIDHLNAGMAKEKKHSTTSEAIEVSRCMEAKFTILTHFSQRFPKIPPFTDDFDEKIGFAFDYMTVKCPSQLPRIPIIKDILGEIFKKEIDLNETRFLKSEYKKKHLENLQKVN